MTYSKSANNEDSAIEHSEIARGLTIRNGSGKGI